MTDTQVESATPAVDTALRDRVEAVLDTLRPAIAMDGGAVELLDIKDGVAAVRLLGSCGGCPMSTMTLKRGIEQRIRAAVPEVTRVDAL
ncbi:MAG: NifU family protein [Gemmatimonadetes bacterium]|nr:NifU family protein [Gemmatimonadota bacterium]